jgi:two-component system, OmpR family, sensor kinase
VTAVFAVSMAVVLVVTGVLVMLSLRAEFTDRVDDALDARSAQLARELTGKAPTPAALTPVLGDDEDAPAQVVAPGGQVVAGVPATAMATADDLDAEHPAEEEALTVHGVTLDDEPGDVRVVVRAVEMQGGRVTLVVGEPLDDVDDALASVRGDLTIGLAGALALACLAGWVAIAAALRPVERLRRRAADISGDDTSAALPVPAGDDELSRLAGTLNAMLGRLHRAVERERALVADAGHELRTPLAILTTELELALEGDRTPEQLRHALGSAQEEVARLTRLSEALLVLARADRGELPLAPADLNVAELLDDVAARFDTQAAGEGRTLRVQAPADLGLRADRMRLEQALGNLVANALQHGGGEVLLTGRSDGDAVVLEVSDQGAGFPDGFAAHAFERFARADDARTGGGAGLGLAIVGVVAAAHGGTAGARGATVTLRLPR